MYAGIVWPTATEYGVPTHVGFSVFLGHQPRSTTQHRGSTPKFLGLPIYANAVWRTTTRFCTVMKPGDMVYSYCSVQPRVCLSVAGGVSGTLQRLLWLTRRYADERSVWVANRPQLFQPSSNWRYNRTDMGWWDVCRCYILTAIVMLYRTFVVCILDWHCRLSNTDCWVRRRSRSSFLSSWAQCLRSESNWASRTLEMWAETPSMSGLRDSLTVRQLTHAHTHTLTNHVLWGNVVVGQRRQYRMNLWGKKIPIL